MQNFYSSQLNENLAQGKLGHEFESNHDGDVKLSKYVSSTPGQDSANEQNYKTTDLNLESQQPQNLFPDFSVSVLKFQDAIESFSNAVFNDAFDTMLNQSELLNKKVECVSDHDNISQNLEKEIIEKLSPDVKITLLMDVLNNEDVVENIAQAINDPSFQKSPTLISDQLQENKSEKESAEIYSEKQNNSKLIEKANSNNTEQLKETESLIKGSEKQLLFSTPSTLFKSFIEPHQAILVNERFAELKGNNSVNLERPGVALVEETFIEKVAYKVGNEGECEIPVEETFCEIKTTAQGADIKPMEVVEECFTANAVKQVGENILVGK